MEIQGTHRIIEEQSEIAEVLRTAQIHRWKFSYTVSDMVRGVTFITEIVNIDMAYRTLTIGSEVKYTGLQDYEPIHFRVQNGGISIEFDSYLLPSSSESSTNISPIKKFDNCRIALPRRIDYGQKRRAVRVNLSTIEHIPVTLFTGKGHQVNGVVDDISTTGLRATFSGDIVKLFETSKLITDCSLTFSDQTSATARVQILGGLHHPGHDASSMRFRFLKFDSGVELKLNELITKSLARLQESKSA